ncbi:hypothetical protein AAG565_09000 [Fontimonas sp. SYSU GA230001]|uniref:hypothetical protein n=1 Tax=Fontimonas sp. SYSU GA230001 TaxID=3142450 RepID=UPI0032B502EA
MQRIRLLALGAVSAVGFIPAALAQSGQGFNPKISLILDGRYAHYSSDAPADVPGFLLGAETGFVPDGFSIGESELVIESNIDDQLHGWTTIALENDNGETVVAVEEAYIDTLALPYGFAAKLGRFYSDIGTLNRQHPHAWDFADAPLAYRAFFAGQLGDDGAQLRWVAPTDLFVEVGAEALRGAAFPAGGDDRSGVGAWTAFAHVGGDIGRGGAWRAGLWHYDGDARDRRSGEDVETGFTGDSRIIGLDFVYKWAPDGNPQLRNFVFQAEAMRRRERGTVVHDPDGSADESTYEGRQFGGYVQAVYQFVPRWRVGLRYDRLSARNDLDNPAEDTSLALLADDPRDPQRWSAMVDFSNSEFSRLRLQFNRDRSRPDGEADNQVFVQYTVSLGAHPAHQF